MTRLSRSCAPLVLALLAGCDDPPARTTPAATQAATSTATTPAASTPTVARDDDAPALDKELEQGTETEIPGGKEAGCIGRVARKHVRVICSARDGHPAPDTIIKAQSNKRLAFKDTGGPVAYVDTIFEPGLDLSATFIWGDKARELTMRWPEGAPRPSKLGSFGAETAYANPCKAQGLEGFGSKGVPCRFKEAKTLTFTWGGEFGPAGASADKQKALFEVENRGTAPVLTLTASLSFYDGAGKLVEQDTLGEPFRATTAYTHDKKIAPKSKVKIALGPERPRIPETVKRIDVTLHEFSTWDPEAYFVREKSEPKDSGKEQKK